ncbi:MAG: signal recognition particle receptor subunit alpha [Candidatus Woesearchaeota archaeon]
MVLEKLSTSLKSTLQKIAKSMFVDEKLINELVKDIQKALLQADVNVQLVFDLTKRIKERALKDDAQKGLSKREQLVKIVYDELVVFLGKEKHEIVLGKDKPFKVMLVGLFGSGKTTTAAKLSRFYAKRGFKVAMLGLDVHRPAAMDQLEQLGKQAAIPAFIKKGEKDPLKIWLDYKEELKKFDIIFIDTAGRDALSKDLIAELDSLSKEIQPNENLLVISADIGQAAQSQAEQFHSTCHITGIVTTKMDGTAKAGGALSACAVTKAPIKFIGVGEKIDELEVFNPPGFVSRILGMGDIEALLEKSREAISEEEAADLGKRLLKGEFNLIDLYEQMSAMKKMGPLSKVMELIPGFGQLKLPKELLEVQQGKLEKWRFIMDSCNKEELEDPETITATRAERIAKGSGVPVSEVRDMLKQYKQSKKLMKMMKGNPEKMMKRMKLPGMGKF